MTFGPLPGQPNIIILMTDQQRTFQWFPEAWTVANLPSFARLQQNGLTFPNNYTNTCRCSPARGVLFSGTYPATNGVLTVGGTLPPASKLQNLATVLEAAGYDVVYKGKWHLDGSFVGPSTVRPPVSSTLEQEDGLLAKGYGFRSWTAPDAGTAIGGTGSYNTLGGGTGANDSRVVDGPLFLTDQQTAVDYLAKNQNPKKPFCLIVSLVNPHDIWVHGKLAAAGYTGAQKVFGLYEGFSLPPSYAADDLSTKPAAQLSALSEYGGKLAPDAALDYVKFYAYLQTLADQELSKVLDAVGDSLLANTIIVRLADHGEMGMAHGGMQEKDNNGYRETINVPMIFSNPVLFPEPAVAPQLASLIDVMPTLATVAGLQGSARAQFQFQGLDLSPTLLDPLAPTQSQILFTMDDGYGGYDNANHIRCLVTAGWRFSAYYALKAGNSVDPATFQYELYDFVSDPEELTNLAYPTTEPAGTASWIAEAYSQLTAKMAATATTPAGWPSSPPPYQGVE